MKNFLSLPLAFIYFYFECKTSPVLGKKIKWFHLYTFMIKVRFLSVVSSKKQNVKVSFIGYTLHALDYRSLENLFLEIFVKGEYHYPKKEYVPEVIFDCGANIGLTTVFFKILYPEAKIKAFEPNPNAFYYIEKNIRSNALKNVFAYQVALSDTEGELELFFDDSNLVTGSFDQDRAEFNKSIKVKTARLSSFFAEENKIDILKIDVEGAEHGIMKELAACGCLQKTKHYFIEYHNFCDINTYNSFLSIFSDLSYTVQFNSKINRKRKYQDILISLN